MKAHNPLTSIYFAKRIDWKIQENFTVYYAVSKNRNRRPEVLSEIAGLRKVVKFIGKPMHLIFFSY